MANLNGDIKKWKKGELLGTVAAAFCAIVIVYFAAAFTAASVLGLETLRLATLISSPVLLIIGIAVSAFCNVRYGGATEKAISKYVVEEFVGNAPLMHPERKSLSFYLCVENSSVTVTVNGYKEKIEFDFSPLGKLSVMRKAFILGEIETRLTVTFCRLYERGGDYTDVAFAERDGTRRKSGRTVYIIKDGVPDKKAFKQYLKTTARN